MAKILDDLSKNLAEGMTRRRALTTFGAGIVGAMAFWSKTGQADAISSKVVFSNTPCFRFCVNLYGSLGIFGNGTSVFDQCLNRCQPVTGPALARTVCPPNTTPVLIGQALPTRNTHPDPEYNPFPQVLAHPYIVCAPNRNNCDS